MPVWTPQTEAEAAAIVRAARARGEKLTIEGGGTQAGLGRPSNAGTVLSSRGLAGITLHEPSELVISARAGMPLHEVEAKLAEAGQMLPFEPVDLRPLYATAGEPTVGGIVAGNWSGPRRIAVGAARDHLIGVRFINGRGEAIKSGGRVMKNVTGLDLVKLQCGAHGTLGFLTEVTFKVLPRPEAATTLVFPGLDDARAVALLTAALTSPFEVSGAAHLPAGVAALLSDRMAADERSPSPPRREAGARSATDEGSHDPRDGSDPSSATSGHLLPQGAKGGPGLSTSLRADNNSSTVLRLENFRSSLDYRCGQLQAVLAAFGRPIRLDETDTTALWADIRDARVLAEPRDRAVWRISVPPRNGPEVMARLPAGLAAAHFYDWGGGLIWLATAARDDAGAAAIRTAIAPCGGHATLIRAPDGLRAATAVFQPLPPPLLALTRRIKAGFDPDSLLNPGRMYADA